MIVQGYTDSEIARMLKVGVSTVANYRNGGKKNDKKTVGNKERAGKKRDSNPDRYESQDDKNRNRDDHLDPIQKNIGDRDNPGFEKPEGSTGDPGSKGITFIGGKKDMDKKEESGAKEGDEYQCYNCSYTQGSPFTNCPKCGASNSFEE